MSQPPPVPARPVPVETLSYAMPAEKRRPGVLTAVGIISIVVGCLSGLSSCGGIASGVMFGVMSGKMFPATPPVATVATTGNTRVTIGGLPWDEADMEDGLEPPETRKVTGAMSHVQALSEIRRQHLGILLAAQGKVIFPTVTRSSSGADVSRAITRGGMTDDGANWYTVGTGRIEISDERAMFRPSTGRPVVEASAGGAGPATQQASGSASHGFTVSHSDSSGRTIAWSSTTTPVNAATAPAPAPVPVPIFNISPTAAWLSVGENALSACAAILLLVAGILVLRDSVRARRLHWIYVAVKIPLIGLAAVATALMTLGIMQGVSAMPGGGLTPGMTTWMVAFQVAFAAGIALVYPVALIFVLRSRIVREYYAGMESEKQVK